jgi:pimeloyl-ACP methyl ester carboxylesterase
LLGRVLLFNPLGHKPHFRAEEGSRLSRIVRGLTYRLAFVPVLLVLFLTALVFAATHPGRSVVGQDPLAYGVYYDPVNFLSEDGAHLEGWLVPVLDAKRVLSEKENILGKRYPAVILVHDFAGSRQQLLPLIPPLHRAGYIVLALNLRGTASLSSEAQTFGIKEAMDVRAAAEMLRRRPYVDPARIALIGVGTGANAALIEARNDPSIAAMVLSDPEDGFDQAFAARVGPDHVWLPPLRNLLRWTFQVMYGVDTSDLDMANYSKLLESRPVLMTDGRTGLLEPSALPGVQHFLRKHMGEQVATAR